MNQIVESSVRSEIEENWDRVKKDLVSSSHKNLAIRFYGHMNNSLAIMCKQSWFEQMTDIDKAYASIYFTKFFTEKALSEIKSSF